MMHFPALQHPEVFWQAIVREPDNDQPRLRYAAWLDERCDPLGEFIRVQCKLARVPDDQHLAWELAQREQELLAEYENDWAEPLEGIVDWCVFRRGFVAEAGLSAAQFALHAETLFAHAPVQDVHLRDAAQAFEGLVRSPCLGRIRHLDLSNNYLRDGGAQLLARCSQLESLSGLNLSSAAIGNFGVKALADSPHVRGLRELYLCDNRVGASGARSLAESPLAAQLRLLHLRFNDFGPDSGALLRRAFGPRVQF